ncbi:hypothetical protein [Sphingomonas sp. Leaf412]|uniref:hypothetical protein n=1 Tax=Sphingomonas sp. Leaf412 TaxID=1736370 RepID=UPI0012E361F3|nr:hypothetical protein [Sphingomonas sp. Leaf412]
MGKSLLWTASDLLTLYLLVSVYSVDPIVAGALFLAGLAANAVADLAVGIWLGRRPHHAARLAGIGLAVAAASFPATVLLAPHGPVALLGATLAFRIAYAGCDVPHNALMTRLGGIPARAAWLARVRTIGTALAALFAAWGVGGSARIATAPMLWAIAGAALLIGSTMLPLLSRFPPVPDDRRPRPGRSIGLPPTFLAANVIGIVALGALAKAVLHLPAVAPHAANDGVSILALLIVGRSAAALIPIRLGSAPRHGLILQSAAFVAGGSVAAGFAWSTAPAMLVALGVVMGVTNLIGWALLPALAQGPRGYGVYTMASKLALGAAGLALAGGLGHVPVFAPDVFARFAAAIALACLVAALLVARRLTSPRRHGLSQS